jgi:hypothetical protein
MTKSSLLLDVVSFQSPPLIEAPMLTLVVMMVSSTKLSEFPSSMTLIRTVAEVDYSKVIVGGAMWCPKGQVPIRDCLSQNQLTWCQ